MDRITKLCGYLDSCETFADIGCDHGYCTEYMLENNLCMRAVIADISAKCLAKAEKLLERYIESGKVKSVCCNGLENINETCDQVLIAGMGGTEIVNIIKSAYIPQSFVFQPMKNVRLLREFLIYGGAEITYDGTFKSGCKFYAVIKGKRSGNKSEYSEAELEYGKDWCGDSREFLENELAKNRSYLERNHKNGNKILKRIELLNEVLKK